jgi:hypothetical protein
LSSALVVRPCHVANSGTNWFVDTYGKKSQELES